MIAVGDVRAGQGRVFGSNEQLTAVNPTVGRVVHLDWKRGSQAVLATLGTTGAFVDDGYASKHHLFVGSPLTVTTPTGRARAARGQGHLQAAQRRARRSGR